MLKVWLPLDGDLRNLGCSNLQITSTNYETNNTGKIGACIKTKTSGYINLLYNGNQINIGNLSLGGWFKFNKSEIASAVAGYTYNSTYPFPTGFILGNGSYGGVGLNWYGNNMSSSQTFSSMTVNGYVRTSTLGQQGTNSITIDFDTWVHIFLTYNKKENTLKLYKNGTLFHSTTFSKTFNDAPSREICINYNGIPGGNGPAKNIPYLVNDVRIYDHCLSAAEVHEIAMGLVLHYKLDGGVTTAKNLIKNGYGELDATNWGNSVNFSSEVPPNHPEIKKSIYNNTTVEYIPIESTHSYKLEAYLKNSATSGNTYPSLYPYDIDKNFIANYHCPAGFNLATMTTLKQELKSGDTKIYVNDLSKWNANSGHYYNKAAIFSYSDSTGYIYPDGTYTQITPAFGSSTNAKTNLDKTNNIITLNNAYSGPTKPAGTAICAATEGGTYYYPFGGLTKSSLNDWTYKTATIIPNNIARLKYAKYIRYSTYDGTLHAGIKLIDLADDIDSTIVSDSSGYGHNGEINGELYLSNNSARYENSVLFDGVNNCIKIPFNDIIKDQNYTISVWTYKTTIGTKSYQTILGGPNGFELEARNAGGTNPQFVGWNWGKPTATYEFNKWTLFTFVHTPSNSKLYVNGELKATGNAATIPTGNYYIGAWNTATQQNYEGQMSDFRIYCTPLLDNDIKMLYNAGMRVDNLGGVHTFEFDENQSNLMWRPENARAAGLGMNYNEGLGSYTQSNCQVTCDSNGYRIYRPPNLTVANNGNTMWGGLKIVNSTNGNTHVYNGTTDNIFGLTKGHTYIIILTVRGKSGKTASSFGWTNQMGWGGGGLSPNPSNVIYKNIGNNFNGETECYYKFTISDDIVKTCTTTYSGFTSGNQYLSYRDFMFGFGYESTESLGTDLYISNIRLFDLTNKTSKNIQKSGIIEFTQFIEKEENITKIRNDEELYATEFIEI